jgi:hypothetical protein
MLLAEWFYTFALASYMVGAAFTFRGPHWRWPLVVMAIAVAADFLVTLLPRLGVESLAMHASGRNVALILGAIFGAVTWLLFLGVLAARQWGSQNLYLGLVLTTQLVWFADYLFFLYGLHVLPMH